MDELKRKNILEVAGGVFENFPILYGIDSTFKASNRIFAYCATRGIKGESFRRLCEEHNFLPVRVGNYLLKKIEQEKERSLTWNDLK